MEGYIDLNRGFFEYSDDADSESAAQQSYRHTNFGNESNLNWSDLLETRYVVVLGEAGSGKSWEFEAQQTLLKSDDKYAFYLRLENLVDGHLAGALDSADDSYYQDWLLSEEPATFFLDSVDEAKLKKT